MVYLQAHSLIRFVLNIALLSLPLLHPLRAGVKCESLSTIRLFNTTITTQPIIVGSFGSITDLPPFCRVVGEIRPTTDSQIRFELWLPLKNWNRKFAGMGNVVEAARRIYDGWKHPITGSRLFPGSTRGSEPFWGNLFPGGSPHPVAISYFRYLVLEDATWNWKTFDFRSPADYEAVLKSESRLVGLNATNPDLRAFRRRGGKILHWPIPSVHTRRLPYTTEPGI